MEPPQLHLGPTSHGSTGLPCPNGSILARRCSACDVNFWAFSCLSSLQPFGSRLHLPSGSTMVLGYISSTSVHWHLGSSSGAHHCGSALASGSCGVTQSCHCLSFAWISRALCSNAGGWAANSILATPTNESTEVIRTTCDLGFHLLPLAFFYYLLFRVISLWLF